MLSWNDYLQLSVVLVSVVNTIGVIPTFIALSRDRPAQERQHTAWVCVFGGDGVIACFIGGRADFAFLGDWPAVISGGGRFTDVDDGHFHAVCQ
jgi:small neutral amino acid transporter SnatA (MarC family)